MSKRKPARTIKARSASKIRSKAAGSGQPKGRANSKQAWVLALLCLVARDIRFVFVTGYGDHGLPAYRDRPTLNKPFQIDALKARVQERLGTSLGPSGCGDTAGRERGAGRPGPLRPFALISNHHEAYNMSGVPPTPTDFYACVTVTALTAIVDQRHNFKLEVTPARTHGHPAALSGPLSHADARPFG